MVGGEKADLSNANIRQLGLGLHILDVFWLDDSDFASLVLSS